MTKVGKRIAIMQPYFLPYIGYWQLMSDVDAFVVYDDVQFTKKGWIHRNRFLNNGRDKMFSLPLRKDSDFLDVIDRRLSPSWDKKKLVRQVKASYAKAPFFEEGMGLLLDCLSYEGDNLFGFLLHSIEVVRSALGLENELLVSSSVGPTKSLKSQERVIAICEMLGADEYVNPLGGMDLYSKEAFWVRGISLQFHQPHHIEYAQAGGGFVSNLSILDVVMFNGFSGSKELLARYSLK